MIRLQNHKKADFVALLVLAVAVIIAMLYFGIKQSGQRAVNRARWSRTEAGIAFEPSSIAYTNSPLDFSLEKLKGAALTIEMAFRPDFPENSSFRFLLLIHDGKDEEQLIIGQWRSSLVIMNGNDYSNRYRVPKIYLQLNEKMKRLNLVTIVSNKTGTRVYLDGGLIKKNRKLVLNLPTSLKQARLVVGNSLSGNNPWGGTVSGLALYSYALEDRLVMHHYQRWREVNDFKVFQEDEPVILYTFEEGQGDKVHNIMGNGPDLLVPDGIRVLQTKMLSWPKMHGVAGVNLAADVLLNLIGFIPLGLILMAAFSRFDGIGLGYWRLIVVLTGFLLSLSIEIAQVWIPWRDSSMLDLLLNTLGGYFGVLVFDNLMRRKTKSK